MTELRVTSAIVGVECLLKLRGEIDIGCSDLIGDLAAGTLESQSIRLLAVDVSEVTFIDSTGLDALVRMHRAASSRGKLFSLRNPSEVVWKVLRLTGLDTVLPVETTDDDLRSSVVEPEAAATEH